MKASQPSSKCNPDPVPRAGNFGVRGGKLLRFKAEWRINNELRITTAIDKFKPKKFSDSRADNRGHLRHSKLQEGIRATQCLRRLEAEAPYSAPATTFDAVQGSLFGSPDYVNVREVSVLCVPPTYPVIDRDRSGVLRVRQVSTDVLYKAERDALGIVKKSQRREKAHKSWGLQQRPKAFTRYARSALLQYGAAFDQMGLKEASSLLTLTLPGSCHEAYDALARWSGWIVNRQLQAVRRYMKRRPVYWFFCWEWQRRGALHQHWCIAGDNYEESHYLSKLVRDMWYTCLTEIGEKEGIDMYMHSSRRRTWKNKPDKWNWNEQQVQKSVARYFAKYASKEVPDPKKKGKKCHVRAYYPTRWQGSSQSIKNVVKSHYRVIELEYITPDEAEFLASELIGIASEFGIVKAHEYEFKIEGYNDVVFAHGSTKILYISDVEYSRASATISEWFGTSASRNKGDSSLQWALHMYRERRDFEALGTYPIDAIFDQRYGIPNRASYDGLTKHRIYAKLAPDL